MHSNLWIIFHPKDICTAFVYSPISLQDTENRRGNLEVASVKDAKGIVKNKYMSQVHPSVAVIYIFSHSRMGFVKVHSGLMSHTGHITFWLLVAVGA